MPCRGMSRYAICYAMLSAAPLDHPPAGTRLLRAGRTLRRARCAFVAEGRAPLQPGLAAHVCFEGTRAAPRIA